MLIYTDLWHGVKMFSQISHIPNLIRKCWAKGCDLYTSVYGNFKFTYQSDSFFHHTEFSSKFYEPASELHIHWNSNTCRMNIYIHIVVVTTGLNQMKHTFVTYMPIYYLQRDSKLPHHFCWYATLENKDTRGNVSKFSVSLACYWQIGSKSTNCSH